MIEGLPWPVWTGMLAASVSLNVLFVALVYRGGLVPRRTHEDVQHEASEWRAESRIKDQQLAVKDEQLALLSEVGRVMNAVLRAVQQSQRGGSE